MVVQLPLSSQQTEQIWILPSGSIKVCVVHAANAAACAPSTNAKIKPAKIRFMFSLRKTFYSVAARRDAYANTKNTIAPTTISTPNANNITAAHA